MAVESGLQLRAEPEVLAAVDLGSNSFHMVVARHSYGQLTVIDRLREMVRLAAGLDADKRLDKESQKRALECLSRFGERIRDMHASRVRVVGTNTLRKARNTGEFYKQAAERLGHPVETISGIEEARLVYLGASHSLPPVDGSQLVIDIGGGSTEVIRGTGTEPEILESLYLGCVSLSRKHFADGRLTAKRFARARMAARLEFQPLRALFRGARPARFVGTSGTIRAVHKVLVTRGQADRGITVKAVQALIDDMIDAGSLDAIEFDGLSEMRSPVFPGGVAILIEAMTALDMDTVILSEGALREGILHDMAGHMTEGDARDRTVRSMQGRFNVDRDQARRVETTALTLLDQVRDSWKLVGEQDSLLLSWAARLHEIGLDIAHAHFHHHGAYLLEHADMPGFSRTGQQVLSKLIDGHRRSIRRSLYDKLPGPWRRRALRLTVLLRLAVVLHRSRADIDLPPLIVKAKGRKVHIDIPEDWLDDNPLTAAGLARERKYLDGVNLQLTINAGGD